MTRRSGSPLIDRIAAKLGVSRWEAKRLKRAFVEALREEVESRFPSGAYEDAVGQSLQRVMTPNAYQPLVIAGLGSFKMKTRPERKFNGVARLHNGVPIPKITKPPARRLVFTSKWEPIQP